MNDMDINTASTNRAMNHFTHTVYSTEELTELIQAIEREGGQVLQTYGRQDGHGIHVLYELINKTE